MAGNFWFVQVSLNVGRRNSIFTRGGEGPRRADPKGQKIPAAVKGAK